MPEQKHKIGKRPINNEFKANVSSQNFVDVVKRIIKSIISYKNQ